MGGQGDPMVPEDPMWDQGGSYGVGGTLRVFYGDRRVPGRGPYGGTLWGWGNPMGSGETLWGQGKPYGGTLWRQEDPMGLGETLWGHTMGLGGSYGTREDHLGEAMGPGGIL